MATISTDITNIPLRKIFRTVDDDTFKTALVSLSKKELTLLKRIYGKTYEELNVIPLNTEETKELLTLLNTKMPEKFRMISEYKQKEKQKKAQDDYFTLARKAKGYDPRLWELLSDFLTSETYQEMLRLLEPKEIIIFALRYGIIKSQYDTKSIAYLLDTDEKFITNTLKLIHTKLGLKNI